MHSHSSPATANTISADLRTILRAVLAVLGRWRLDWPQMQLVHRRITRTFGRIERLLQRHLAGRLWQIAQRVRGQKRDGGVACRGAALPRRFGWLVIAGGYQAAGFGTQLQAVLNTPEMVELLAASAQARRLLRPWCRALAVECPSVGSTSQKVARESGERPPRTRRPRPAPEPFRIPFPRGLLSAARRQGFGKLR